MKVRCLSRTELYAVLDSDKIWDQLEDEACWNNRKDFQQTDRHPDRHGLLGPLNLTARWRSAKLDACFRVSCHLSLF